MIGRTVTGRTVTGRDGIDWQNDALAGEPRPLDGVEPTGWLGNAGVLVIGRLLVAILGWVGTIIVARNLDQEAFGRFTFVFGLLGMMSIVTDLGLGRVALSGVMSDRVVDAADRRAFAGTYVVLRLLLGFVGYGVALGFTIVANYPSEIVRATAVGGVVVVVATASHGYELVLQAHLRMGIVAVGAVFGRLAQLGLITAAVVADSGLVVLMLPAVVAELVIAGIKIPKSISLQPMVFAIRPRLWWSLLKEAVPISIGTALATLYFRVDSIMLSKLSDFTAVGIYGIAFKFVDLLHFVALSVSVPLLTVLVRSWPDDIAGFKRAVERTVGLFALLAGGLIVHFGLFAAETVELLYGSEYRAGATAVQLLVLGEIIGFGSIIGLTVLTATAKHRPYPYVALLGLVVNIGLNLWAIGRYGYAGAAVTTVVTEIIVVAGMWLLVRRVPTVGRIGLGPLVRIVPPMVAALLGGALVDLVLPWPIAALIAVVIYCTGSVNLGRSIYRADADSGTADATGDGSTGSDGMRVVVVGHSASGSGAERVLLRYVDAMTEAGWSVEGACPEGYLARELRTRGIDPWILPDLQLPEGNRATAVLRMLGRWGSAGSIIRSRTSADEVIVVNGLLALPAVRLSGRSRSAVWLVHDVVVRRDLRLVARLSTKTLAAAVGVSDAAAAFPRSLGISSDVIRNGTAWPIAPAHPATNARPIVGINAMVTPWKGHEVLLEAVADLPEADLEILGGRFPKDGDHLERLERRAEEPDLAGRVRFLGHRNDPLDAMRSWSVAVSASTEPEAGPLAVLEAMSLGIPVVATGHGGAVEVVGSAGLLVEPGDVGELTIALRSLVADSELRQCCSTAGRESVAAGLTEAASNEAFLNRLLQMRTEVLKTVAGKTRGQSR